MIEVRRAAAAEATTLIPSLVEILIDCVEGGASVGFMSPLSHERAERFWQEVFEAVAAGRRLLLVAEDETGIVGTVQLDLALPDNQAHRANLMKMLVHRRGRRRGIAQQLLSAAEAAARVNGRTVLVLDAVTGGDAARLYERCGWQRVGDIPKYALMPDGTFCSTTYFFKHL